MIDKRIGKRMKQCRERLGLTQDELAEKTGLTPNYISTVERGASFPRCEKLITLLNGLETNADAVFCDVLEYSTEYEASQLSKELASLPRNAQKRILQMVELMIQQEKENGKP
ncbi:MAG: helix-turn-helix domain-containing protein [Candidatus Heritagella sp.]